MLGGVNVAAGRAAGRGRHHALIDGELRRPAAAQGRPVRVLQADNPLPSTSMPVSATGRWRVSPASPANHAPEPHAALANQPSLYLDIDAGERAIRQGIRSQYAHPFCVRQTH